MQLSSLHGLQRAQPIVGPRTRVPGNVELWIRTPITPDPQSVGRLPSNGLLWIRSLTWKVWTFRHDADQVSPDSFSANGNGSLRPNEPSRRGQNMGNRKASPSTYSSHLMTSSTPDLAGRHACTSRPRPAPLHQGLVSDALHSVRPCHLQVHKCVCCARIVVAFLQSKQAQLISPRGRCPPIAAKVSLPTSGVCFRESAAGSTPAPAMSWNLPHGLPPQGVDRPG